MGLDDGKEEGDEEEDFSAISYYFGFLRRR